MTLGLHVLKHVVLTDACFCNCRGVQVTLCHPGPIATGADGQIRSLYGSSGLLTEAEGGSNKARQSPKRVAALVLKACHHGLDSVWIAKHPVLLLGRAVSTVSVALSGTHWILSPVRRGAPD